jgi:hypothetical protein
MMGEFGSFRMYMGCEDVFFHYPALSYLSEWFLLNGVNIYYT